MKPGSLLEIDGKDYRVRVVDQRIVTFLDVSGKPHKLPHQALLDLKPRIGGLENAEKTFEAVLADGTAWAMPACVVVRLKGGKVTRLDEYLDSAHSAALTALGR